MRLILAMLFLALTQSVNAQEFYKESTQNFDILTLSDNLTQDLKDKVEGIKARQTKEAGYYNFKLDKPIMLIVMDEPNLIKFFDGTEFEPTETISNRPEPTDVWAIWIRDDLEGLEAKIKHIVETEAQRGQFLERRKVRKIIISICLGIIVFLIAKKLSKITQDKLN